MMSSSAAGWSGRSSVERPQPEKPVTTSHLILLGIVATLSFLGSGAGSPDDASVVGGGRGAGGSPGEGHVDD